MKFKGDFIDGRFILPTSHVETALSEDPGDLDHPVGEFIFSKDSVPLAVSAARKAFPAWAASSEKKRSIYLLRFQRALKKRKQELSVLISQEMGKALEESKAEVERMIDKIDIARLAEPRLVSPKKYKIDKEMVGKLRYRPRGVLAILSPFNLPAYLASSQTFAALHAGNAVILKPSELTPFVGQFLAELWQEAGIPSGVFNLVQGRGEVGHALVTHPDIQGVIFTGSWETGSKIQAALLQEPQKICVLEMGGKNSVLVVKDADLENAVAETFRGVFLTTGQRCNSTSRIILEKSIAPKFIAAFLKKVDSIKMGYGQDAGTFMGPVVSEKGLNHFLQWIEKAPLEGFEVLKKGGYLHLEKRGYYVKPSVHLREGLPSHALMTGTYMDDEIFGPDAAIYIVRDLEEAIALNNRSRYGLVASIFSKSRKTFEAAYGRLENGIVNWNVGTFRSSPLLPFGGLKQSGNFHPAGFFTPYLCTIPTSSLERI